METTLTLEMKFGTADGKTKNVSLKNPKAGLTSLEIQPVMQTIVGLDAFEVKGINPYATLNGARYVQRSITDVFAAE